MKLNDLNASIIIVFGIIAPGYSSWSQHGHHVSDLDTTIIEQPNNCKYLFEMSAGTGFQWLGQISAAVLPSQNMFIQIKGSSSILSSELNIIGGLQIGNSIINQFMYRFGVGYSWGDYIPIVFGEGGDFTKNTKWQGIIMQIGTHKYISNKIAFSLTFQAEIIHGYLAPGANVGIVWGILK